MLKSKYHYVVQRLCSPKIRFCIFFFFFFKFHISPGCSFKCYHLFSHEAQGWNVPKQFDCRDGFSLFICLEQHISNGR